LRHAVDMAVKAGTSALLIVLPHPSPYMDTLVFATSLSHPYLIKFDSDLFIAPDGWRRLLTLGKRLTKDDFVATGLVSNGLPLSEHFLRRYLPNVTSTHTAPHHRPGTVLHLHRTQDYTRLNSAVESFPEWDPDRYWSAVLANVDGPYKGIHPIRMDKHAAMALNRHLAKNLDSIFWGAQAETGGETRAEDMLRWHGVPYLTNSVFVIRQKDWREIVHESPALFVDQWDEVPISRVLERGRALLVDPAIPVIHPAYNTIPTEQEWAEKNFISKVVVPLLR